jgi:hypothetical protein
MEASAASQTVEAAKNFPIFFVATDPARKRENLFFLVGEGRRTTPDDTDRREGRGLPASELRTMQRGNLLEREEICRRRPPDAERGGRPLREKPAKRRPDDAEREGRQEGRGLYG